MLAACPAHIRPAIALMMFTRSRTEGRANASQRATIGQNEISTRRSKTGRAGVLACPAQLIEILAQAPRHDAITLCANSDGKPWTVSGFRASWRKVRVKLEHEGKLARRSRCTACGIPWRSSCGRWDTTSAPLPTCIGQKTLEMARHYAKHADAKPKMRGVITRLDVELDKRKTKAVKPDT